MTIDKATLLARAKADPVAFREETAKALLDAYLVRAAADVRGGGMPNEAAMRLLRRNWYPFDAPALAHVEALAEALGVAL